MIIPNVFVRGHVAFTVDGEQLEFIHQNISVHGVPGLPWGKLSPRLHHGKVVSIQLRILTNSTGADTGLIQQLIQGTITREKSLQSEHMGLRFILTETQATTLGQLIRSHGYVPTDYVRKYPRIPANSKIQTFPLRALVLPALGSGHPLGDTPMVFDLGDLSPNGLLLYTENSVAATLKPGDRIDITLEPRGWFPTSVQLEGLICRVTEEIDPSSKNVTRLFGIKVSRVDDPNKILFLDLLKGILEKLKGLPDYS